MSKADLPNLCALTLTLRLGTTGDMDGGAVADGTLLPPANTPAVNTMPQESGSSSREGVDDVEQGNMIVFVVPRPANVC